MSPQSATTELTIDLDKAVRLHKLVESGRFDIRNINAKRNTHDFSDDNKRPSTAKLRRGGVNTPSKVLEAIDTRHRNSEICQLLLSPARIEAKTREGRSKVLSMQHKIVWMKHALNTSRLFTNLQDR